MKQRKLVGEKSCWPLRHTWLLAQEYMAFCFIGTRTELEASANLVEAAFTKRAAAFWLNENEWNTNVCTCLFVFMVFTACISAFQSPLWQMGTHRVFSCARTPTHPHIHTHTQAHTHQKPHSASPTIHNIYLKVLWATHIIGLMQTEVSVGMTMILVIGPCTKTWVVNYCRTAGWDDCKLWLTD